MRILLVNPLFPPSLWDFAHIRHIGGSRYPFPPLPLAVLAALTPPEHDIAIVDENIGEDGDGRAADIVAITGYDIQKERVFRLARQFRQAGAIVALGGPLASEAALEECRAHADAVFIGEAEYTWPRFIADAQNGAVKPVYRQEGHVPMAATPVPRFDLLRLPAYATAVVETSRGCPFSCDFCEVPVRMGAKPRMKEAAQVMREIGLLHDLGAESVFIIDDNFVGNRAYAVALLTELARYQEQNGHRLRFSCQLTLAHAFDADILPLLGRCGFRWVFVGIETPDRDMIKSVNKMHNLKHDLLAAVRNIQAHNLVIWAGIIVGFDGDNGDTIEMQRKFITEAGIPVVMVSILQALPGTPLYRRMEAEQRLVAGNAGGVRGGLASMLRTNILPRSTTPQALERHYLSLVRGLYGFPAYARRLMVSIRHANAPRAPDAAKHATMKDLAVLLRIARYYLFSFDAGRIYYFFRVILELLRNRGLGAETVFMHLAVYIHLREFHRELGAFGALPRKP